MTIPLFSRSRSTRRNLHYRAPYPFVLFRTLSQADIDQTESNAENYYEHAPILMKKRSVIVDRVQIGPLAFLSILSIVAGQNRRVKKIK